MAKLYDSDGNFREVDNINFYLMPGPNIFPKKRNEPLCPVPKIITGNRPTDGGNLLLNEDEKNFFVKKYPNEKKFIKQCVGGKNFLHNEKRFCLWLVDATPDEIKKNKFIYERVNKVREFRLKSSSAKTRNDSEIPHLFQKIVQPAQEYLFIPQLSSERRKYIPMDFLSAEKISLDPNLMIPEAEIWHFGILTSSVHMAWTKLVCGRLKSDFRYSAQIVYNNFVWMRMEFLDYAELNLAVRKILSIRKKYKSSLADLYDEVTMPKDLRDAHKKLDKIVMKIYGYDEKMSEEEIQIDLLYRYQELAEYRKNNPINISDE